jgi:hypothetical protein
MHLWIKLSRMRLVKKAWLLSLAALWLIPMAYAQGPGVVDGRIVNATNPANPPARVPVDVMNLAAGMSVMKSTVSDGAGKFHIDGLPTDTPLLLRATFGSVNYYGQVNFDPAGKAQVEIQAYEATASTEGIRVESAQIAFKLTALGLSALESCTFVNETKPPRSFMRADGNFRFSKATGIAEPPHLDVSGPGATMPVSQSPLESPDGQSYYSLYPLRPGKTAFEVSQLLPYQNGTYTYRKKFYHDMPALSLGVIPKDMKLSGEGLFQTQTGAAQEFAFYSSGPVKAGTEVVWIFTGGTPVAEVQQPPAAEESVAATGVRPMPTLVGQNAMIIGPLLLVGLVVILWYAHNRVMVSAGNSQEMRIRELRERREQLLKYAVSLDLKYTSQALNQREYLRLREQTMRHLRRISMLLEKK